MDRNDKVLVCAKAAHEMNRIYCKTLGDYSQAPWEQAPQWAHDSAIKGVEGVLHGNTPEQSHECWLKEKAAAGWKFGLVKDVEKKEHPCFVPYSLLPKEQQMKDHLFISTVKAMAKAIGLEA
jgi:hypothetical protein